MMNIFMYNDVVLQCGSNSVDSGMATACLCIRSMCNEFLEVYVYLCVWNLIRVGDTVSVDDFCPVSILRSLCTALKYLYGP